MKQLVFQTLEESEKYWSSAPIEEKKKIIQFSHQKDSLNTNYSIWGAANS